MMLSRLIYVSEPYLDPSRGSAVAQLRSIMSSSRRRNEAAKITGALIFDEGWFLQILEGDRQTVWQTFSRIAEDDRHAGCLLIEMVEISKRLFGNWWMGLATRNGVTEAAFAPHLVNGSLRADRMSAADILKLACSLSGLGLDRDVHAEAS